MIFTLLSNSRIEYTDLESHKMDFEQYMTEKDYCCNMYMKT